jgi:hypothetical protein
VKEDPQALAALAARVDRAFPRARARWSPFLLLGVPMIELEGHTPAQIDLKTRTIRLSAEAILENNLEDALEALLAHEIGHLVAAPGSLAAAARLMLLERTFLPPRRPSLTLPFYELLIDERLGVSLAGDRRRILQAEDAGADAGGIDPAMLFTRAVLEELWQRPPGDLMGEAALDFERRFRGYRVDAQLVAQNLFALAPSVPLQFLYFASIAYRYARQPEEGQPQGGAGCECMEGEPSAEDWAEALIPQAAEKEAIRRAIAEGWLPSELEAKLKAQELEQRIAAMPGKEGGRSAELVTGVMAAHYRREAERWLFRPPPATVWADELVPTTLEAWDPGDPVASIDWVSTLLQRGERLGTAMPLLRERIADEEGRGTPSWEGRTEIYLDVSCSMPDPKRALNAMTLAAQILALGTVRAGGAARALVYSTGYEKWWTFSRSETVLSRFLLHYIGAGTDFPFDVLEASLEELGAEQPVRIIITDRDFDGNYDQHARNAAIFAEAASRSPALVLLLNNPDPSRAARYEKAGARVASVRKLDDFPRLSAELSFALFEQGGLPTRREEPGAPDPFDPKRSKPTGPRNVVPKKLVR